ncbi:hypothetical protein CIPAW_05G121300 [Carya illinoinensis]|uniref:Endonuclease/exonuclease/phosphatase domain-containing protein n=1 Tax=Carya illinoinensis TaxID=32201 RepID=A0A8T1QIJ4_CARIL|nr:hypothetical protein CIPAW_05G121300 [Carya illinoinensis]
MILSWNVRGLNVLNKRLRVKNLIHKWRGDVICFQETKLKSVNTSIVRSLWSCHYVGWVDLVVEGASGGIIVMWDRRVVELIDHYVGDFMVACHFKNVDYGVEWAFAGVYGPNLEIFRRALWDEMAGVCCCWDLPWCSGGDFNVKRFPSERVGDSHLTNSIMISLI